MVHIQVVGGDFAANVYSATAKAMHRIEGSPFAPFAQARWDYATSEGAHRTTWSALGGVRLFLDPLGSTLQSSQRTGAAMDTLSFQYLSLIGD